MKTAIVIGATGLIGNIVTKKLLDDVRYEKIKVFIRKPLGLKNPKLEEYIVDFNHINDWKEKIIGDELYSALGTTIKKAGSKEAQYKIDFTYQFEVAKFAAENRVGKLSLVSSLGADKSSRNFYLQMKGDLDEAIKQLPFNQIFIFRPSILSGERSERRLGETLGIKIAGAITTIIPALKKYRPIPAEKVAEAMIKSTNQTPKEKIIIYEAEEISLI